MEIAAHAAAPYLYTGSGGLPDRIEVPVPGYRQILQRRHDGLIGVQHHTGQDETLDFAGAYRSS